MKHTTTTIYRVTGTRDKAGASEKCSDLRRTKAAARRLADRWESLGRGPIRVEFVVVDNGQWVSVP